MSDLLKKALIIAAAVFLLGFFGCVASIVFVSTNCTDLGCK